MPKVYIAGAMSGHENFNREAFMKMEKTLVKEGCSVMNPAVLSEGFTQKDYMSVCMPMMMCCDTIVLLKGWENSLGARAEAALAQKLEMTFMFE